MWFFCKKKSRTTDVKETSDNKNEVKSTPKEVAKEEIKNDTAVQKETSLATAPVNNATPFHMGVEAKFLIGNEYLYSGTVRGTINVGDEICIVNPGDYEVKHEDTITLATPNVTKAKVSKISFGQKIESVNTISDSVANIQFEEDIRGIVRTGTVFCKEGTTGTNVLHGYWDGLGNGFVTFARMNISDEVYSKMSLNDMADVARIFMGLVNSNPAFSAPEMKDEIQSKMEKLGENMGRAILLSDSIYVLYNKKSGEPHMFSQYFERPDESFQIQPPLILVATEQNITAFTNAVASDSNVEIRKIEAGSDKLGIKNFFGNTFYLNGATALCVNYLGFAISADYIVPAPDYTDVPEIKIPITNPMCESMILLNSQFDKVETDEEKKRFNIYSSILFRQLAKAKYIVPMKIEGEIEKTSDTTAVFKKNTKLFLATMDGKNDRPAVRMFTDWQRMSKAGYKPEDGWSGNVVRINDMITDFDCAINVTTQEHVAAGIYISKNLYESQIAQFMHEDS